MTFRVLATILFLVAAVLFGFGVARADIGNPGNGAAPGLCDYPAICMSGMVGEGVAAEYWFFADEPTEVNGSHRHCEYAGAVTQFSGGINVFIFAASVSAPIGALVGSCSYRCPNNTMAAEPMPNPPSLWLSASKGFNGVPCKSAGDPLPLPAAPGGIAAPQPAPEAAVPAPPTPDATTHPLGPGGGAVRVVP